MTLKGASVCQFVQWWRQTVPGIIWQCWFLHSNRNKLLTYLLTLIDRRNTDDVIISAPVRSLPGISPLWPLWLSLAMHLCTPIRRAGLIISESMAEADVGWYTYIGNMLCFVWAAADAGIIGDYLGSNKTSRIMHLPSLPASSSTNNFMCGLRYTTRTTTNATYLAELCGSSYFNPYLVITTNVSL